MKLIYKHLKEVLLHVENQVNGCEELSYDHGLSNFSGHKYMFDQYNFDDTQLQVNAELYTLKEISEFIVELFF